MLPLLACGMHLCCCRYTSKLFNIITVEQWLQCKSFQRGIRS